jgi:radical SAM protein with 4Fe4S-binding SPASM domain
MCPTGCNVSIRPAGFMSHGTFIKILKECARYNCHIRFVRWGEPLLHPELTKFIGAVKGSGLLCHINTNGMFIDDEFCVKVIKYGLDSIKFSFQGIDKYSYEKIRCGANWEKLILGIKRLHDYCFHKRRPHISIGTTITNETPDEVEHFKSKMLEISDEVNVGRTVNIINPAPNGLTPDCPEMFDKLSINWNGTVTMCCADWNNTLTVGHLEKSTLSDIWNSKEADYYRKMIVDNRHGELIPCQSCHVNH